MVDLSQIFDRRESKRDKFLARLLGLFSEEIVHIWTHDPNSPYEDLGRPTITQLDTKKRYTLDFTLSPKGNHSPKNAYVTEMKCWTEFENYRFLNLSKSGQLERLTSYPAFKVFLRLLKEPKEFSINISSTVKYSGNILIWSRAEADVINEVKEMYGLYDVLTLENIINDLNMWNNSDYKTFLDLRSKWCSHLFDAFGNKNNSPLP